MSHNYPHPPASLRAGEPPAPAVCFTSTKSYDNYPCAHRQHRHGGNCALIHGYSRSFHFVFGAHALDACGFVVDFGEMKWVKGMLDDVFDHTLLLCHDDPLMPQFKALEELGACTIRILPYGVGMESTAQFLCEWVDSRLREKTKGRCWVIQVESRENSKNSGIYTNPDAGFHGWL